MILQYDLEGNLIGKFKSIKSAAAMTGSNTSGISNCASGRYKKHNGYVWEKVQKQKPKKEALVVKKDNYDRSFIEGEIDVFRINRRSSKPYHIYCFNRNQAEKLTKEINKRFEKWNWKADWYYRLVDDMYVVECEKVKS